MKPGADIASQIQYVLSRSPVCEIGYFDIPDPCFSIVDFEEYLEKMVNRGQATRAGKYGRYKVKNFQNFTIK